MALKQPDKLEHYDSDQPLFEQSQKQGGWWADLASVSERNAIPEAKRKKGMAVNVAGVNYFYIGSDVLDVNWTNPANWSLLAVQEIAQTIDVAISGGNFTSVKAACDSITDATALKPYTIKVEAGVYTEAPFTIPDYVEIIGYNCNIKPSNNSADFITLGIESEIKGCKITPPTSANGVVLSGENGRVKDSSVNGACTCAISIDALGCVVRDVDLVSATKGLCVNNGGSLIFDALGAALCTTALETSGNASIVGSGFAAISCTTDLRTLGTSTVELAGSKISTAKLDIVDWDNIKMSANSDQEDDEALVNLQELQVGAAEKGYETVLGEGDSYTRGMLCYTETPGGVFTDRSEAAKSASGSTVQFDGVAADNSIYLASTLNNGVDYLKFFGNKTKIDTAIVLGGGEIVIEYWNGAAWQEVNGFETDAGDRYYPHAKNYFQDLGSHQIRYDISLTIDTWTANDPMSLGTDYYWLRYRIKTAITTSPIIEQFKLHTNRFEINADGFEEKFGKCRSTKQLNLSLAEGKPFEGSMQSETLYISQDIGFGGVNNKFTATGDKTGVGGFLAQDLDTSCPVKIIWTGRASLSETIEWTVRWGWVQEGDPLTTTEPGAITNSRSTTVSKALTANQMSIIQASIDVSEMLSRRVAAFGDQIWISIQPSTMGGQFALGPAAEAEYTSWNNGGHI